MRREELDVLIIGAGISGIGQACHMIRSCPGRSFAVLEGRARIGGTWDLFRYPGIRSDSDMFTFGYRFRPWKSAKDIAPGPEILKYLDETVDEFGLRDRIRLNSRISALNWLSEDRRWFATVTPVGADPYQIAAKFVSSCTGYYDYEQGYLPEWEGFAGYGGRIAHPQHWPDDLDYAGKRVLVIGSGATAVTIVPKMAETAAHVTMLQRSPTYIFSRPAEDAVAKWLNRLLPWRAAWKLARIKNVLLGIYIWTMAKRKPDGVRAYLRRMAAAELPEGFDVDRHFSPAYDPWDQRLCLIPDGDFYAAIRSGKAGVITDHIARFTPTGVVTTGGETIDADIVVPATGLRIQFLGGISATIDGKPVNPADHMVYRGMMLSDIPNFAVIFGYANASWTLKADLTADFVCRLVNRMHDKGHAVVSAPLGDTPPGDRPLISLNAGYLQRARSMLPTTSDKRPWRNYENYVADMLSIRYGRIDDGVLRFA